MGGVSIWHALVLLVLLGFPVLIGVVVWLAVRARRHSHPSMVAGSAPPPLPPAATVEARLRTLEDLHARGVIDQAEYERQRQAILAAV
ncbi:SHOCT domain-containing protein [Xanthomonas sp. AmX2]|uniref:SHOCT domain-containing protein n=1 Tax=Xanthomonas sp. TaxID=29446 RepID=UPI00197CF777|nr:SHOCT domain-containing protein [Xanthomonas sp.]MBN6151475.1 SHOCT domain-containing protein [Xanthomonas sp.]